MYQRSVLDNQLRVLTSTMDHTQSVSMVICVGAGSRYESNELAGVSHFIEHLPFKGTENWPTAREVSEAIEGVGGVMNASTDREMTVFWCKVALPHYKTAFAVLVDMVLNSILDPEEGTEGALFLLIGALDNLPSLRAHRVEEFHDDLFILARDIFGGVERGESVFDFVCE